MYRGQGPRPQPPRGVRPVDAPERGRPAAAGDRPAPRGGARRAAPALPAHRGAGHRAHRGFEALLRWRHPMRGLLRPGRLHARGRGDGADRCHRRWVLREACGQLAAWQRAIPAEVPLRMSVNVSTRELAEPDLRQRAGRGAARGRAAPRHAARGGEREHHDAQRRIGHPRAAAAARDGRALPHGRLRHRLLVAVAGCTASP